MATVCEHSHKLIDEEPKIPVLTVLKNGAILKNIFIVNNCDPDQLDREQILIVGRHPDCNIILTHPSISRSHLQILSNPSSHKLFVIDLSSVHGTWVSEKKIDPWARVELREGDSFRIGGSSRIYKLHWIPLSQAYDFESHYVSASDAPLTEEIEEEVSTEACQEIENEPVEEEENIENKEMIAQEEECEGNNSLFMENKEIQSLDLVVEGMSSLFAEESLGITVKKEIPSAPPMPENPMDSLFDNNDKCVEISLKDVDQQNEISRRYEGPFGTELGHFSLPLEGVILDTGCEESCKENQSLEPSIVTEFGCERECSEWEISVVNEEKCDLDAALALEETENQSLFTEDFGQTDKSPSLVREVGGESRETENQHDDPEALYALESSSQKGKQENSEASYDEVPPASERLEESEDQKLCQEDHEQKDVSIQDCTPCIKESVNSSFLAEEAVLEISDDRENQTPPSLCTIATLPQLETIGGSPIRSENTPGFGSIWSRRGKPANVIKLRTGRSKGETMVDDVDSEYEQHNQENIEDKPISKEVFSCLNGEEEEIFTPDKENFTPNTLLEKSLQKKGKLASVSLLRTGKSRVKSMLASADSENEKHNQEATSDELISKEINSCLDVEEEEIFTPDKENFTPNTLLVKSLKKKGKLASLNQLQTGKSRIESVLASAGSEGEQHNHENIEGKLISKEIFPCLKSDEEIFTPDKENVTPNTLLLKSLKKKGLTFSPNMHPEENLIASSKKENQTLRVLQELKPLRQPLSESQVGLERELMVNKRRQERVPFQSLVVNCVGKTISDTLGPLSASKSSSSVNCTQNLDVVTHPLSRKPIRKVKRSWTVVADTTTLLNKGSRKSLQLLQGLRGTRLIIPRMVIRELDCLKRRGSLFRRKTEACLVLEWIEQCMVEKPWWIHVQSSAEDLRLTAPTPPASPRSPFSQGSGGIFYGTTTSSLPFLSHRSSMEIASPTTEDHILECSLLCRKTMSDGQLVLLSDDVTLKIKAMAEGLICETVQEFRESLMNPFSERFLWVDSSPRGQTWSVMDDVVLREKYSRFPMKSLKGESAKGLKLILLHNSHYGQRTPIS
ncbi:Nuclear inhibitor of protein phosphatase 1 [Morus notabilis]|uniref:Nuclear inhibitor of protein phosphatase 1 n=1 Tax=Morus notabilis TaxID=981085 RepID=W9QXH1_9ROSA|nr:Nuclear inhibitor of protein phosphatase 1 [Morus notabilis]